MASLFQLLRLTSNILFKNIQKFLKKLDFLGILCYPNKQGDFVLKLEKRGKIMSDIFKKVEEVTELLSQLGNTEEREFGAFKEINDNYPKYVLSLDKTDFSQNGIIHKNIIDWLLDAQKQENKKNY